MEHISGIKNWVIVTFGAIGSVIVGLLGGWDKALETLFLFMTIDYFMGMVLAGVFKKSSKTTTGALDSKMGWIGLCRKGITLIFVIVGTRLDTMMGVDYIRYGVIIGFCIDELLSIVENAGLMGLPVPSVIANAIEVLKKKSKE